jgi:glycosyltransferase involved in cell wall biosynthesis
MKDEGPYTLHPTPYALSVTMVAPPSGEPCGVRDYTEYLLAELRQIVDVRFVTDAERFTPAMNGVDLAHVQHQYFLFGGVAPWKCRFRAFANRLRVPAVMTVHEFVSPGGSPSRRAAIALANRLHFRHSAIRHYMAHTQADRERMAAEGLPRERITVVRHGVPPAPALPAREEARRALGLEKRFLLTMFGFLSRRKGHLLALEALKLLPTDVMLLIAGGRHPDDRTNYVNDIKQTIQQAGWADRARITGYLPPQEAASVLSAADLVIAPFLESSGSGSLAYAFACGKPILASDIAAHREILGETPGALALFPAGDIEQDSRPRANAAALAQAVAALRDDPEALSTLAAGARRYAETHSYARMAEETAAVYHRTLEEERSCA